jgi:hypothetical protein
MVKEKINFLTSVKTAGSTIAYSVVNPNPLSTMFVSLTHVSAGSSVVAFEGLGTSGSTYVSVFARNITTGSYAVGTTGTNLDEIWSLPIAGFEKVRLNVTLSSGSLTAVGKVVY